MNVDSLRSLLERRGIDASTLAPLARADEQLYHLEVDVGNAVATWDRLRTLVPETGYWPVIQGGEDDWVEAAGGTVEAVLSDAESMSAKAWFEKQYRENLAACREELEHDIEGEDEEIVARLIRTVEEDGFTRGPWPEGVGNKGESVEPYSSFLAFESQFAIGSRGAMTRTWIALIPTVEGWQVPTFFDFGGWNACPYASVHAALLRDWGRRYDAELMTLTRDIVEMRVGRPPRDRDGAIELAKEHFLYCCDTVDQGYDTIDRLAASLLNSPLWYFWWD